MKKNWKRQLIAKLLFSFKEARSLDLMAMSEFDRKLKITVSAHVQYIFAPNQSRITGATSDGLKLKWIATFSLMQML